MFSYTNALLQVPAVAFGGPKVSPDQPSPDSAKIAESLILLEFVADLYPSSGLLPSDPVSRARIRFFIDTFSTKFAPSYHGALLQGGSFDATLAAIEALQEQLPKDGKYLLGDQFTIADAAVAPFLGRAEVALSNDFGKYPVGEGKKVWETLSTSPKYARFWKYFQDLKARDSFKSTFDEVSGIFTSDWLAFNVDIIVGLHHGELLHALASRLGFVCTVVR